MNERQPFCTPEEIDSISDATNAMSDEELVVEIAGRSEVALKELIARHAVVVASICRRICFDEYDVNCIVSEVFWEFWRRADAFDHRKATVRTFLLTIARSRSIDRRRAAISRERAREAMAARHNDEAFSQRVCLEPCDVLLWDERANQVKAAMDNLPPNQRQAIELAFFDGLTHEQVANQLGAPLGTVKTRIRSGLRQLREMLAEYRSSGE